MCAQNVTPEALKFYEEAEGMIDHLASRWKDECEYEDLQEYRKPLEPIAERCGVVIEQMQAHPFGCRFSVGERQFRLHMNAKGEYEYRRIK